MAINLAAVLQNPLYVVINAGFRKMFYKLGRSVMD